MSLHGYASFSTDLNPGVDTLKYINNTGKEVWQRMVGKARVKAPVPI